MPTNAELLDLDLAGLGQRTSTWRVDVLDSTLAGQGTITPALTPMVVSMDTGRPVMRTLEGLVLPPGTAADLDPLVHRLRVVMMLENGGREDCGVFAFVDQSDVPTSAGTTSTFSLADLSSLLADGVSATVVVKAGADTRSTLETLIADGGLAGAQVDPTSFSPAEDLTFLAGTPRLEIINRLGSLAGYLPLYVDRHGTPRMRRVPLLAYTDPAFDVTAGRFYAGSVVVSSGILSAPNRYLAVDSGSTASGIVGVWDVPASSPNSISRIGRVKTKRVPGLQGLGTQTAADEAAQAYGVLDLASYAEASYAGPPDPRHEPFDACRLFGTVYVETGYRLACREGDPMTHDLRLVYQ